MSVTVFLLISLCLFVFGTLVGSFLSVIIVRSTRDEQWMIGKSHCDNCNKTIAWYDNIPLLSFLLLGGKCRHCNATIPAIHPVVEMLTGILFVWWYWGGFLFFQLTQRPFSVLQPMFWLGVGVLLVLIFFIDWIYYIIPNTLVTILTLMTVSYRAILVAAGIMQVDDLAYTLLAAVVATSLLGTIWLVTKGKGMGFGDVKLIFPLALLMGWSKTLVGLASAFVIGASIGILLVALRRKKIKSTIPFGPFLIMGTVLSLVWGDQLLSWYLDLLR